MLGIAGRSMMDHRRGLEFRGRVAELGGQRSDLVNRSRWGLLGLPMTRRYPIVCLPTSRVRGLCRGERKGTYG